MVILLDISEILFIVSVRDKEKNTNCGFSATHLM